MATDEKTTDPLRTKPGAATSNDRMPNEDLASWAKRQQANKALNT